MPLSKRQGARDEEQVAKSKEQKGKEKGNVAPKLKRQNEQMRCIKTTRKIKKSRKISLNL